MSLVNVTNVEQKVKAVKVPKEPKTPKEPKEPKAVKAKAPKEPKTVVEPAVTDVPPADISSDSEDSKKKRVSKTLPAKYNKFMQFAFWLANSSENGVDQTILDKALFGKSLDEQVAFYQKFLDESKANIANMRSALKEHSKLLKKAQRDAIKAEKMASKPKTPRVKKTKTVADTDADANLVQQLVDIANNNQTTTSDTLTLESLPVDKPADKPADKKPRAKKTKADKPPADTQSADKPLDKPADKPADKSVEKKPRAKKTKVEPAPVVTTPVVQTNTDDSAEHDDEELSVKAFIYNGVNYLIDDDGNLYSTSNDNAHLGTFINNQLSLF